MNLNKSGKKILNKRWQKLFFLSEQKFLKSGIGKKKSNAVSTVFIVIIRLSFYTFVYFFKTF